MDFRSLLITIGATAALASCSGNSTTAPSNYSENDTIDFITRYGYVELPDSMNNSLRSVMAITDMRWDRDGAKLDYKRLYARAATPDSGTFIDMVCDYIPSNSVLTEYAARQLNEGTLCVRLLDDDQSTHALVPGDNMIPELARSISTDFTSRVYPQVSQDTALLVRKQYGTVNVLIDYVTSRVLTYSTYYYYYIAGAAHGMEALELQSYNRKTNKPLTLTDIVPAGKETELRAALLDEIVAKEDYASVDNYISSLNEWLGECGQDTISADTFPIYSIGLTQQGLTFAYPKYSIAPGARGVPVYTVPYDKLKGLINF